MKVLASAVMEAVGGTAEALLARRDGQPNSTYRQIARLVASELGYHHACIARVCGCSTPAVDYAKRQIERRLGHEARHPGDGPPLLPVVEKARQVAKNGGAE